MCRVCLLIELTGVSTTIRALAGCLASCVGGDGFEIRPITCKHNTFRYLAEHYTNQLLPTAMTRLDYTVNAL